MATFSWLAALKVAATLAKTETENEELIIDQLNNGGGDILASNMMNCESHKSDFFDRRYQYFSFHMLALLLRVSLWWKSQCTFLFNLCGLL
jgi:hypothetical protein